MSSALVLAAALAAAATRESILSTVDVNGQPLVLSEGDDAFEQQLRANVEEHEQEARALCEQFYCDTPAGDGKNSSDFDAYPMSAVPSVDFPASFADRDVIYVSKEPLFTAAECDEVIRLAELEGHGLPSTRSGKYQIGKAFVKEMPSVLKWFNQALSTTLYPTLSNLFPELLPDPSTLRAHSVIIVKYNESLAQTDIHVDDALFAFTVALSDPSSYEGGGTHFEHLGRVIDMGRGHVTFRPGAVRHAGHAVTSGVRYVLGGFIMAADKVEHVRRLSERGSRQLQAPSPSEEGLRGAERLFNWALSLNGDCSHCHSNLGATYLRLQQPAQAEAVLRKQLALLPTDSDAYFSLGSALRAQKRTEEALKAFDSAVAIAPNDFESHVGRSACYSALSQPLDQIAACKAALAIRPDESQLWMEVGHAYMTRTLNDVVAAENSYLKAADVAPTHAAPHLALGRLLAQRSRLEEAVGHFRAAHSSEKEAFGEAKLAMAVGTARAQQGRLGEANANYAAALRLNPADAKLAASIAGMEATAKTVEAYASRVQNAVDALCGTPCQDIVDASGVKSCAETWTERCAASSLLRASTLRARSQSFAPTPAPSSCAARLGSVAGVQRLHEATHR